MNELTISFECFMLIILNIINPTNLTYPTNLTSDFRENSTRTTMRHISLKNFLKYHIYLKKILKSVPFGFSRTVYKLLIISKIGERDGGVLDIL